MIELNWVKILLKLGWVGPNFRFYICGNMSSEPGSGAWIREEWLSRFSVRYILDQVQHCCEAVLKKICAVLKMRSATHVTV